MYSSQPREPAFSPLAEPSSPDSFNGQSTRSELRSPIGRSKAEADSVVLVDEIQTEDPSAGRSALLPTVSPFEMDTNDGVDSSSNVRDARKRITDRSRALFAGLAVLVLVAVIVTTLLLRYSAKKHITTILISFGMASPQTRSCACQEYSRSRV